MSLVSADEPLPGGADQSYLRWERSGFVGGGELGGELGDLVSCFAQDASLELIGMCRPVVAATDPRGEPLLLWAGQRSPGLDSSIEQRGLVDTGHVPEVGDGPDVVWVGDTDDAADITGWERELSR